MKHRPVTFGIDYDDTITQDPELFKLIIGSIKERGHKVYIVTSRSKGDYSNGLDKFVPLVDGVIFTECKAKTECADIDIWIDDFPLAITHDLVGARFVPSKDTRNFTEKEW